MSSFCRGAALLCPAESLPHCLCWLQRAAGMLGLRAEDVPSESDEEHVPTGALANQGQVLVSATLPQVLMPWQQGVFRDIFEDPPALQCELPNPQVLLPLAEPAASQASKLASQERPTASLSQSRAGEAPGLEIFSKVIRHKTWDPDFQDSVSALWAKAIKKWQMLFEASPSTTLCKQFNNMTLEERMSSLRDIFGSKSPHTVEKRATSLVRFLKWLQSAAFLDEEAVEEPLAPSEASVYRFCQHVSAGAKGKLAAQGFVQALTFVRFVLAVPAMQQCLSPRVQGLADRMAGEHDPAHQARDLTVLEVQFLEECVAHDGLHVLDRFAAGVFLFQIYARNRWSDIRFVRSFEWDFLQVQGQTEGYIEARSKDVKQSNRKKKQTLFMPLVAPVRGVHPTIVWGVAWKDVASKVGRRFDVAPLGPLLPAVDAEGKWLKRTVDSQEASAWLTQLLRKRDPSMERVTTHSLKHTPLGWLSKYGIYGETQTLLSHHSTGALSTLAYSRDALSGPLRQFERLLKQIRLGAFSPDSTRSGYWTGGKSQGPESTIGSWEDVTATSNFSTSALPVLQTGKAASFQPEAPLFGEPSVLTGEGIADESLPPATDEDSPSGAPVNDSSAASEQDQAELLRSDSNSLEAQLAEGVGEALLLQEEDYVRSPALSSDFSDGCASDRDSGDDETGAADLQLPDGFVAVQNIKSTMLHLCREGGTALKCGPWVSSNFERLDKPTTVWVRCSKCFAY